MIEWKTDVAVAERTNRRDDFAQTLAAIIAVTRRDWLSQRHVSAPASPGEIGVNRAGLVRSPVRLVADSARSWPRRRAGSDGCAR